MAGDQCYASTFRIHQSGHADAADVRGQFSVATGDGLSGANRCLLRRHLQGKLANCGADYLDCLNGVDDVPGPVEHAADDVPVVDSLRSGNLHVSIPAVSSRGPDSVNFCEMRLI